MSDCLTCQPPADCEPLDPFALYSINGETFPFMFNGPTPQDNTSISITCCKKTFTVLIPLGASTAVIQALVADLWAQCNAALVACPNPDPDVDPDPDTDPTDFCFNTAQSVYGCCPDGTRYGFAVGAGRFFSTNCAKANAIAREYASTQARIWQVCLGDLMGSCTLDDTISMSITAWGPGVGTNNAWTLFSGTLPPGLILQTGHYGDTITLSGTPTTPGVYKFTVNLTSVAGSYGQRTYIVEVLAPMTQNDAAASSTLTAPSCAAGKTDKTLDGSLPDGLNWTETIGGTDIISGTPTTVGTCAFKMTYT